MFLKFPKWVCGRTAVSSSPLKTPMESQPDQPIRSWAPGPGWGRAPQWLPELGPVLLGWENRRHGPHGAPRELAPARALQWLRHHPRVAGRQVGRPIVAQGLSSGRCFCLIQSSLNGWQKTKAKGQKISDFWVYPFCP